MSYLAFHAEADKALAGKFWGGKIPGPDGTLRDTGVQEYNEEVLRLLSSQSPIPLHRPLEFINYTNGPGIIMHNVGQTDWMAIRIRDRRGNESQMGIGLGNENLLANEYIPHPDASIDPFDANRFYSDLGGNAGRDRNHPQAIFANNGLFGPSIFAPWVPIFAAFGAGCGNLRFALAAASVNHMLGEQIDYSVYETAPSCETTAVDPPETIENVCNLFFGCIDVGDVCLIAQSACGDHADRFDYPFVVAAPTKQNYLEGTTDEAIAKGGSGDVSIDVSTTVSARSPFCAIPEGVDVGMVRDVGASCGSWTILAADCPA